MSTTLEIPTDVEGPAVRPFTALTSRVAVGGALTFGAAVLAASIANPGYSQRSDAISSLGAQDAHATIIMTLGFLGMASGLIAAGATLFAVLKGKAAKTGSVLVLLAGLAGILVALNPLDCSPLVSAACRAQESAETVSGAHVMHNLASLVLFTFIVAGMFFLAAGLRRNAFAASLKVPTRLAAVVGLVFMLWFGSGAYGDNGGLVQRVLVLVCIGWPAYLAFRTTRLASV